MDNRHEIYDIPKSSKNGIMRLHNQNTLIMGIERSITNTWEWNNVCFCFVVVLLYYAIATAFQLHLGDDMML